MRYRLRTLLILLTAFCIYAAWVGYMKNAAAFHRKEANRIVRELAQSMEMTAKNVETNVTNMASRSRGRVDSLSFGTGVDDILGEARLADHRKAVNHTILVNSYEQSILQPWKIVKANFTP